MQLPSNLAHLAVEKHYLPLTHGRSTAFSFGKGPVILCLHGFPDNCFTYRYQVEPWVKAGYRVVLPAMRGYEPGSVQPDGRYYIADLAEDVVRWIDVLGEEKVHLVGHDWGGVTAWAAAGLAPERLHSVTSISIPYLKNAPQALKSYPQQLLYSWYMNFFQLRGIADWGVSASNWQFIRFLWQRWSPDWQAPDEIIDDVVETLSQTGVKKAALGYYRCMYNLLSERGRDTQRLLRKRISVPALLITGVNDGCMHTGLFDATLRDRDFPKGVSVHRITGAGHFVQLEKPEKVTRLIEDFAQNSVNRSELV